MKRLTQLTAQTREETFIFYLVEINSIDRENVTWRPPVVRSGSREGEASAETLRDLREQELPADQEESITDPLVRNLIKQPVVPQTLEDENHIGPKRQRLSQSDMPVRGLPLCLPKSLPTNRCRSLSSSAPASLTGMTSMVLLVERTAEALLTTSDNCRKTSDVPFIFICLFIPYYDMIPSHHLSPYSHCITFILFIIFIV
jgi:hypothetical protein